MMPALIVKMAQCSSDREKFGRKNPRIEEHTGEDPINPNLTTPPRSRGMLLRDAKASVKAYLSGVQPYQQPLSNVATGEELTRLLVDELDPSEWDHALQKWGVEMTSETLRQWPRAGVS